MTLINPFRRTVLKSIAALAALSAIPSYAFAAAWPKDAFGSSSLKQAMKDLYGSSDTLDSDLITLDLPRSAQYGAVVPVSVKTDIKNVKSVSLFVEGNPYALAANFVFSKHSVIDVSTRIKMAATANVIAVVEADGRLLKTTKNVAIEIGGCGSQIPPREVTS
jgi:sulfur-oxidizing protein SoxY